LGIQNFYILKSDRWGDIPELKPSDNYIGGRDFFQNKYRDGVKDFDITPECEEGYSHFISAQGYYVPCSHLASHQFYYKTPWGKQITRSNFDIAKTTFSKLQHNEILIDFDNSIANNPCDACKFNCPKQNV